MRETVQTGGNFEFVHDDKKEVRTEADEWRSRKIKEYYEEQKKKKLENESQRRFFLKLLVYAIVILVVGIFIALKLA